MTSRLRWLLLAGVCATLSASVLACGEETVTSLKSRCAEVSCGDGFECDEADGLCKCGGWLCAEGEICNLDPTPTCASPHCDFGGCERGMTCDAESGDCLCGETSCDEDEWCVNEVCVAEDRCADVSCGPGTSCDPADGFCKCGDEICEENESCVEGECVVDLCAGVSCGVNSVCNPEDGNCHCGDVDGWVCSTGEACLAEEGFNDDGDPVVLGYACAISSLCEDSMCDGGTVCDPEDGQCRCGGVGTGFPACTAGQSCIEGECRGGNLCAPEGVPVVCAPGLTCDPNDGVCKCGGRGGEVCGEGAGCTALGEARTPTCTPFCTLLASNPQCGTDEDCYYDASQTHRTPFCAPEGGQGLEGACEFANDCHGGLFCNLAGFCSQICDINDGQEFCQTIDPLLECVRFAGDDRYGYCRGP